MKTLSKTIIALAAFAVIAPVTSANAFQIDACAAYASGAVNQQHKNLQLGCGFSGLRWHSSFSAHKAFCQGFGVPLSLAGNQDRAHDLNRCQANRFQNNEIIIVPNRFN